MKIQLIYILLIFVLFGCGKNEKPELKNNQTQTAGSITVSAAISLKNVFDEIGTAFQAKTVEKVNFNFGASGVLQKQIENGAPIDVFASAGEKQMNELEKKGLIDLATRADFAKNSLVIIVPNSSNSDIKTIQDLAKSSVKKIAVGNPKTVPAGQYADESLRKTNLQNVLEPKLIFAENVRQVLDYVVRGEVDAGIVYTTDALTAKAKVKIVVQINENNHQSILYPLAIVKDSGQRQAAQKFADFVRSREGQNILRKYGFMSVSEK